MGKRFSLFIEVESMVKMKTIIIYDEDYQKIIKLRSKFESNGKRRSIANVLTELLKNIVLTN